MIENEKKNVSGNYVVKSIYVPPDKVDLWLRVAKAAKKRRRSTSETVLIALEKYLNDNKD